MKIGVFAYNFKHWKTQEGIQNLILAGFKPRVILAADPVKLNFYKSKVRIGPKDLYLTHPRDIAECHGIDYRVVVHNSEETSKIVKDLDLDVGIILGARILKPIAFSNFNIGVINMHPGILPENRGLDNLKWAILKNIPQGVTAHLIDKYIDRGYLICRDTIKIYEDDTLVDIHLRIQNLEQSLMIKSLEHLVWHGSKNLHALEKGEYHKSVPPELETNLFHKFEEYKKENSECRQ